MKCRDIVGAVTGPDDGLTWFGGIKGMGRSMGDCDTTIRITTSGFFDTGQSKRRVL